MRLRRGPMGMLPSAPLPVWVMWGKWEELRVAEPSREVHRDGGPRGRHREELRDLDVSPGLGDEWAAGAAPSQEKDLYQFGCPQPAIDAPE